MVLSAANVCLSLLEGIGLIASPCILPVLPIILSGSLEGGRQRPYGIIVGFVSCFALFTYFSRELVVIFGLDLNIIRYTAFALLLLFGEIMISSYLTEKFNEFTQGLADFGLRFAQYGKQTGFISGIIFGALIGLIWTPCAGPILAAVIVQTILQPNTLSGFITILSFSIGAAIPMLLIVLFGRMLVGKLNFLQKHSGILRKILGVIIILTVLLMLFDNSFFAVDESAAKPKNLSGMQLVNALDYPYPAPELQDITAWINSPPLQLAQLRGKVVLIDFWAYSCINCIRTVPHLVDWYKLYHDHGLVIIGVHSPEFDFERNLGNVQDAVRKDQITYPIALDNNFATWQNFNNQYWPAHYLIDRTGKVVYTHFGEGDYAITENNIRFLLGFNVPVTEKQHPVAQNAETPETYCGYERSAAFMSNEPVVQDKPANYTYPQYLALNAWALQGKWIINDEKIVSAQAHAKIKIHFKAQKVFGVMGATANKPIKVQVKFNDNLSQNKVVVQVHTLYDLLSFITEKDGDLELDVTEPGLELYTFTFG